MRTTALFLIIAAFWTGCTGGCNPMEEKPKASSGSLPVPTSTPTPVTILSETYPSTVMAWYDPPPPPAEGIIFSFNGGDGNVTLGPTLGCVSVSSPGLNSTIGDHLRNDFTTAATAVTTRFAYDFILAAGLANTVEVRLELDTFTRWRFEIKDNGGTIFFNGAAIACGACGTPATWHTVVVVSNGNNTTSLTVNGTPVGTFTALSNDLSADDAVDKVHLMFGGSLNGPSTVFQIDDVSVTAP